MRLPYRSIAALALLAGLAACAPVPPAVAPHAAGDAGRMAPAAGGGVIAAMRDDAAQPAGEARARILRIVGGPAARPDTQAAEFIIRTDDGQTISVMQSNEDRLRPGERIVLVRSGARTRILRAAP